MVDSTRNLAIYSLESPTHADTASESIQDFHSPRSTPPLTNNTLATTSPNKDDELLAIQALGQLKNGIQPAQDTESTSPRTALIRDSEDGREEDNDDDEYYDTAEFTSTSRLLNKVKNHPIVNSAVRAYNSQKPALKYGVEIVERAALPMVNIIEQTSSTWKRKRRLSKTSEMFPDHIQLENQLKLERIKRQNREKKLPSISEALSIGNKNLNELSLNMSIESRKRLTTCLQLLMLANKQISSKVNHLQQVIAKEQESLHEGSLQEDGENNENEIFHDAQEEESKEIKKEIISTVKKVVSFISKYAGNSLPEPARSSVRETLLKLPTKWQSQTDIPTHSAQQISQSSDLNSLQSSQPITSQAHSSSYTNRKVLLLATESLEMVSSVISIFDETLGKAEVWMKQKQEKQLVKQAMLNNNLRKQKDIKDMKEREEREKEGEEENENEIEKENDEY